MQELTRPERRQIKQLVRQCANCETASRLCLLTDMAGKPMVCPMLSATDTGKLCAYFRAAVLPLNPVLAAGLAGHREVVR